MTVLNLCTSSSHALYCTKFWEIIWNDIKVIEWTWFLYWKFQREIILQKDTISILTIYKITKWHKTEKTVEGVTVHNQSLVILSQWAHDVGSTLKLGWNFVVTLFQRWFDVEYLTLKRCWYFNVVSTLNIDQSSTLQYSRFSYNESTLKEGWSFNLISTRADTRKRFVRQSDYIFCVYSLDSLCPTSPECEQWITWSYCWALAAHGIGWKSANNSFARSSLFSV